MARKPRQHHLYRVALEFGINELAHVT